MTATSLITGYLGSGLLSARPTTPTLPVGGLAFYYATDTTTMYEYPYGGPWTAVGGGGGGDEVLVSEIITSGSQSSITFTPPASGYRDLVLRFTGRSNTGADNDFVTAQLNGDTGANYNWTRAGGTSGGGFYSGGSATNSMVIGVISAATSPAGMPGQVDAKIAAYNRTVFNKFGTSLSGGHGGAMFVQTTVFDWNNTAAVSSVVLALSSGSTFVNGSVASLYART